MYFGFKFGENMKFRFYAGDEVPISLDKNKISVIELDSSGNRTNHISEFIKFSEAKQYIQDNTNDFDLVVGENWVRNSDQDHELPSTASMLTGVNNIINVEINGYFGDIGNAAFASCAKLKSLSISDSTYHIGDNLCAACDALEQVNIPSGNGAFSYWGSNTFAGCVSLTRVNIHNGVTHIGGGAFQGCIALSSIEIPSSVESIDTTPPVFNSCVNLTEIVIHKSQDSISGAPWGAENAAIIWTG